jgi:hypothetical protein
MAGPPPLVAGGGIVKLMVISEKERHQVEGARCFDVKALPQVGDRRDINSPNILSVEAVLVLAA